MFKNKFRRWCKYFCYVGDQRNRVVNILDRYSLSCYGEGLGHYQKIQYLELNNMPAIPVITVLPVAGINGFGQALHQGFFFAVIKAINDLAAIDHLEVGNIIHLPVQVKLPVLLLPDYILSICINIYCFE